LAVDGDADITGATRAGLTIAVALARAVPRGPASKEAQNMTIDGV